MFFRPKQGRKFFICHLVSRPSNTVVVWFLSEIAQGQMFNLDWTFQSKRGVRKYVDTSANICNNIVVILYFVDKSSMVLLNSWEVCSD